MLTPESLGTLHLPYSRRLGICEGMEFFDCPAWNKCLIENIKLKLTFYDGLERPARTIDDSDKILKLTLSSHALQIPKLAVVFYRNE